MALVLGETSLSAAGLGLASHRKRWSRILVELSKVVGDPSAVSLVWRTLDADALDDLARPLEKLPFIESDEREPQSDEEKFFATQLSSVVRRPADDKELRIFAASLWRNGLESDEREMVDSLRQFHGSRAAKISGKGTKSSSAISLYFNERRALLLSLNAIMSSDHLAELRKELLRKNLIRNVCKQISDLTERIHDLLVSAEHREALRPQLQVASLIWERKILSRVLFLALIGNEFAEDDVVEILKLTSSVSRQRSSLVDERSFSMAAGTLSIMTSPLDNMKEWIVWEKSHTLDTAINAIVCSLAALQSLDSPNLSGSLRELMEYANADKGLEWDNLGCESLLRLAWDVIFEDYRQDDNNHALTASRSFGEYPESGLFIERRPETGFTQTLTGSQGLRFLRCLLRSAEFACELPEIRALMTDVLIGFLDTLIRKASAAAPSTSPRMLSRMESQQFSDNFPAEEGPEIGWSEFLLSRTDERNIAKDADCLEDLIECIILVLRGGGLSDYAVRFFMNGDFHAQFLKFCSGRAAKHVYFNLVTTLVETSDSAEFTAQVRESDHDFISHTVRLMQDLRDGRSQGGMVDDFLARLRLMRALYSYSDESTKLSCSQFLSSNPDFVQTALTLAAHPLITNDALKMAFVSTMASFVACQPPISPNPVVEIWNRFLGFPQFEKMQRVTEGPRLDVRTYLNQVESSAHSYGFTISILNLTCALVRASNPLGELEPLIKFVLEDVFFHYDERVYSHPGERWLVCVKCVQVFLAAVESCNDAKGAGYMVLGYFLCDSPFFSKLLSVLSTVGNGNGASGLMDALLVLKRVPTIESPQAVTRPDWFAAWRRHSGDQNQEINSAAPMVNLGPLLHASVREDQLRQRSRPGQTKNDIVSMKIVKDWLSQSSPSPVSEHPYLWDDGDPSCENRILSAKLVLRLLSRFLKFQDKFIASNRSAAFASLPLRVETLILSKPHLFVNFISSYIGFDADRECRKLGLEILDEVAVASPRKDEQVFAWVQSSSFEFSLLASSAEERTAVSDFLCRHAPLRIMRECAPALIRLAEVSRGDSQACVDAVRSLAMIFIEERSRLGFASRMRLPSSFVERLVKRFLDVAVEDGRTKAKEIVMGLSWTLRLAEASGNDKNFLFKRSRDRPALFDSILAVTLRSVPFVDGDPVAHALQSWQSVLYSIPGDTQVGAALMLAIELLQTCADMNLTGSKVTVEFLKAAILLIDVVLTDPLQQTLLLTSRDEAFALVVKTVDSCIACQSRGFQSAFASGCVILTLILEKTKRLVCERKDLPNVTVLNGVRDAMSSRERIEPLMNACLEVMGDRMATPKVKGIAAMTLHETASFMDGPAWVEAASRKGILQGVIMSTISPMFEAASDASDVGGILNRCADESVEPILRALAKLITKVPTVIPVFTDSLTVLWRQRTVILGDDRSAMRLAISQDPNMAKKRARAVLPLLNLVSVISQLDTRFGIRFLRQQKPGVLAVLSTMNASTDGLEAHALLAIMVTAASIPNVFASELGGALEQQEFWDAAIISLCQTTHVIRQSPKHLILLRTSEFNVIRCALLYLTNCSLAGSTTVAMPQRRDVINSLNSLITVFVDNLSKMTADLEKALLLLYSIYVKTWAGVEDSKMLKILFPRIVGGDSVSSNLERLMDTSEPGIIKTMCVKLAELRFR